MKITIYNDIVTAAITYHGKPCKQCLDTLRYRSSGDCIRCGRLRAIKNNKLNTGGYSSKSSKYYYENKDRVRDSTLQRRYGISAEEYEKLFERQNGVCAICEESCKTGRNLAIDHNHSTGKVRGLLCVKCNRALGYFQDDRKMLSKAVKYLEENDIFGKPE